jgi:hypothetical protein
MGIRYHMDTDGHWCRPENFISTIANQIGRLIFSVNLQIEILVSVWRGLQEAIRGPLFGEFALRYARSDHFAHQQGLGGIMWGDR